MNITENITCLLAEVPSYVTVEAAVKTRTAEEIIEAIEAGIRVIGENYVQEAVRVKSEVNLPSEWHFIGHLQKNKVKTAIELFDMIETVDSTELAGEINKRCAQAGKIMPILIEVNSGREAQKSGVMPEEVEGLIKNISGLTNVRVCGLMTMGPANCNPEAYRRCFRETKQLFDHLKHLNLPGVDMKILSMGMTDSWREAIEEGSTMIRIGSLIFGERN